MKTIVVNLLGGPGIGKSRTASGIFSLLKIHDVKCELVPEYAKDLVWEKDYVSLKDQQKIFKEQYNRLRRVDKQVNVIITDSPLLFTLVYNTEPNLNLLALKTFNSFSNLNFFLSRVVEYNSEGRYQDEEGAKKVDQDILNVLSSNNIKFENIIGDYNAINIITEKILKLFGKEQEVFISSEK